MNDKNLDLGPSSLLKRHTWSLAAAWVLIITASLLWNLHDMRQGLLETARIQARSVYERDAIYLKNSAFMTREGHERAEKEYGILGHITSLTPIHPGNAPDPWETQAFQAFEHGQSEFSSIEQMEGKKYMRLMRPFLAEEKCLACHETQGDEVGDIQGGISVSIPMESLDVIGNRQRLLLLAGHLLLGLIGWGGIALESKRLQRSERKRQQAEEVLREHEKRLNSLVETLPEGVCLLDREQRLILANPAAQEHLQILTDVNTGDVLSILGEHAVEEMLKPCEEGKVYEVVGESLPRRIFEVVSHPLTRNSSESGWVIVIQDVTQERQLQRQMQQQDRLAAVGQLTAGIAHNFNNMLGVIIGNLELAMMENPDVTGDMMEYLKDAVTSSEEAAEMIKQLMLFGRKTDISSKPVEVNPLLERVARICRTTFDRKIVIEISGTESVARILGDRGQLYQVLLNLCINARDAVESLVNSDRLPRITMDVRNVRLRPEDRKVHPEMEPGDYVRITVTDNGQGMDASTQQRVYDPFFTTKETGKGTGLGLAVAYRIVAQHKGWFEVESQPDMGTTFSIYLPAAGGEGSALQETTRSEDLVDSLENILVIGGSENILVVEDEASMREVLSSILTQSGYTVLYGRDGREGLEVFKREQRNIDLILLDLSMPRMSGYEVLEEIKALRPDSKVVILTGSTENRSGLSGVTEILHKPIQRDVLLSTVRAALDAHSSPSDDE